MTDAQYQAIIARLDRIIALIEDKPATGARVPLKATPPPVRGESVDAWLDWRETNMARGYRNGAFTLAAIAAASGHSESTLRKRSANRMRRYEKT